MSNKKLFKSVDADFLGQAVFYHIINNTIHRFFNFNLTTNDFNLKSFNTIDRDSKCDFELVGIYSAIIF